MFSRSLMIFSSPPSSYISQFVCVLRFLWEQSEPSERHSWSLEAETESSSAVCRRGRSSTQQRQCVCVTEQTHTSLSSPVCLPPVFKASGTFTWTCSGETRCNCFLSSQFGRHKKHVEDYHSRFCESESIHKMFDSNRTTHVVDSGPWTPLSISSPGLLPLTMLRFKKPSSFAQNSSWKHGFSATQGIKPLTSASINVFKEELNSFSVTVMLPGFVSSLSSSLGCDVNS